MGNRDACVPKLWEWIFFIPFPFPNFGNGFFSFPSRSRIEGMGFFNSLPVPELWEWNYPFLFPFPNSQMSFPLTPAWCPQLQASSVFPSNQSFFTFNLGPSNIQQTM